MVDAAFARVVGRATAGLAALLFLSAPAALAEGPTEYEVKAAYLYNFARFVEWPAGALKPEDPLIVGVLGNDPFGPGLLDRMLTGKSAQGHPLELRHPANLTEAARCHLLFISGSDEANLKEALTVLSSAPVLTISDIDRFVFRGGIIGFERERNRIRFNVNLTAAARAPFKISSDLLKLAKLVRGAPQVEAAPVPAP